MVIVIDDDDHGVVDEMRWEDGGDGDDDDDDIDHDRNDDCNTPLAT
jgi:hypothetical protein